MTNDDQEIFWSQSAGPAWVFLQSQMDCLMQPVLDLVLEAAVLRPGDRVLDVGCGTGASVLEASVRVGDGGHVTGLDIADTMLDLARARLADHPNTSLIKADAQNHAFEPGAYDALISRFGVMFFDDTVAAFGNMARGLAPGAALTLATWGPAPDNPWFMEPASAARDVLGPMPKVDRTLPGPFAFEDPARIMPMLEQAGLVDVQCATHALALTPRGSVKDAADLCCRIGPADSALQYYEASDAERAMVSDAIALRFAQFDSADGLRIPASIHIYEARKSA
ncbi:methyltransferase domain-containing protein [uncultured Tateyamaria sp.]|uniref:class I SAM-dependent methyltransferase n=1 Tax=uncultured Tateyamaria sp. TaxID=455651 RepID=UPI002620B5BC|nr:methyltransferase domain-containing protein [uncultured Tateyamaria sp.]